MRAGPPSRKTAIVTSEPSAPEPPAPEIMQAAERHGLGSLRKILTRRQTVEHNQDQIQVASHYCEFEHGIVYQDRDKIVRTYPWERVSRVYLTSTRTFFNGVYGGTNYAGSLVLAESGDLPLKGWFHDPAIPKVGLFRPKRVAPSVEYELFQLLSDASAVVSQLLLPGALAQLEQGEALPFGDISISLAGLQAGKGLVPWDAIRDVQLQNGAIEVKQARKFMPISYQKVGNTPNLPLFLTLVDTIRRSSQRH